MGTKLDKFKEQWARITRLEQSTALLAWDMETYMPEQGVKPRSEQLAILAELAHQWCTSDETGRLIEEAEAETGGADHFSDGASMLRVARRTYDINKKVPQDLVARFARTTVLANSIWVQARANSDFSLFEPILSEIIDLNKEKAEYLGYSKCSYDALLDLFEQDLTTAQVEKLFKELKTHLIPLVKEIVGSKRIPATGFLDQKFSIAQQEAFGLMILRDMSYDFTRGRQDRSAHPFTTSFSPFDVRITTRFSEDDLLSALFSTIHEGGHALYEQGLPLEHVDTPLCQAISLGLHESQSRLWENIIGRSRGFWKHYFPLLKSHFPGQLDSADQELFYRAANLVKPGLIRVEADELTYNLHIFIRFEIEKDLMTGAASVKHIPELWNTKYSEYLGVTPPDDGQGCLQDIHWAHGSVGYFPTYTIGNLLATQFYNKAVEEHPAIPAEIDEGNFQTLLGWLRKNIHGHGSRYTCAELVRLITGDDLQVTPFVRYLSEKFNDIYR